MLLSLLLGNVYDEGVDDDIMTTMMRRMVIMVMDHNVGVRSLPADHSVDKSARDSVDSKGFYGRLVGF